MKFKFNFKLTAFLVSLFIGLLLVILGSYNKYCLSFGFIILGCSVELFIRFQNEKITTSLAELEQQIDELEQDYDDESDYDEENDYDDIEKENLMNEQVFVLQQLYHRQKKLIKQRKSTNISFRICSVLLICLGIFGMF